MPSPILISFKLNQDFVPSDLLHVIGTCLALWIEWVESKENTNALQCSNSKSRLQLLIIVKSRLDKLSLFTVL